MIRHVVCFRWKPEFDTEAQASWRNQVMQLPEVIPQVRNLLIASDLLRSKRSWDVILQCDFDSLQELADYATHPSHLPIIEISSAGAEQICSIDYDLSAI